MRTTLLLSLALAVGLAACGDKRNTTIVFDTASSSSSGGAAGTAAATAAGTAAPQGQPGGGTVQPMTPTPIDPKTGKPVPQSEMITLAPVEGNPPPTNAQGLPDLAAVSKHGVSPAKAPTPELAPRIPNDGEMKRHGDTLISPSGLKYIDLKEGSGPMPKAGDLMSLRYVAKLANGTQFDASTSFTTAIDAGQLILGLDEGLMKLKQGGKRRIIIPPSLGYGAKGAPPTVPPNSTLIYDVDVILLQ